MSSIFKFRNSFLFGSMQQICQQRLTTIVNLIRIADILGGGLNNETRDVILLSSTLHRGCLSDADDASYNPVCLILPNHCGSTEKILICSDNHGGVSFIMISSLSILFSQLYSFKQVNFSS